MSTPTQAARKRDYTKFNLAFARLNRDKYIGFDGKYEGPENSSRPKPTTGRDAPVSFFSNCPNADHLPLPTKEAAWQEIVDSRRVENLFLWLGSVNYKSRKYCGDSVLLREIETSQVKIPQRTPYDELSERFGSDAFMDAGGSPFGFQIKKIRRPERKAPAWMMSNERLKLLIRNLRYDKRGTHMGFTMQRSIYVAYLYYRCRINAAEIAGWISNNYEWFGFKAKPDVSQATIEGVIKRITARGNRFFNKLQGYSEPLVTVIEGPDDAPLPETFDQWVDGYVTELDEMSCIQ